MFNGEARKILLKLSQDRPHFVTDLPDDVPQITNPVSACGDQLYFSVQVNADHQIDQAVYSGQGCLLAYGGAELMLAAIEGQTVAKALEIINQLILFLTQKNDDLFIINHLMPLSKLRENDLRKDCVLISATSLQKLLLQLSENE